MSKGLVVREGSVDLHKARLYAQKNKIPFIDLREGLIFANVEKLNNSLSLWVSRVFRRPLRASVDSFFSGDCFGNRFVAIIPHDFLNDFINTTKVSPVNLLNALSSNESRLM